MTVGRAVFDTNIFLSAFTFGGNPGLLFDWARSGKFRLIISPAILCEFASILKNKFSWVDEDIQEALVLIGRSAELVKPERSLTVIRDEADNRILECALEGRADTIVSGDSHLLSLKEFQGIQILSAAAFLRSVSGGQQK